WEDVSDEELNPPLVINAEMLKAEVRNNLAEMQRLLALHNTETKTVSSQKQLNQNTQNCKHWGDARW
ncbi:MAG: hypothetical protein ACRC46_00985, partial [Thermoguttaceae bacterium]